MPLIIMLGIIQNIVAWTSCVSPLSVNGFDAFSEVVLANLEFTVVVEKRTLNDIGKFGLYKC